MVSSKFYSHVNFSVTKIQIVIIEIEVEFYSHVNFSVTKMMEHARESRTDFTVT